MSDQRALSDKTIKTLRLTCLVVGIVGILVSLMAKFLGLSVGTGFTLNQVVILCIGVVLLLAGITGRRFPNLYRGFAVFFLNALVVAILVDLLCLVLLKIWSPEELERSQHQALSGRTFRETSMPWGSYESYVVWKADTSLFFQEHVGPDGFRITPGSVAADSSYLVYVLGGSTVWGVDAPDSCTIPAWVLRGLASHTDRQLDVRNLGQYGWVSTQELLELLFRLRSGERPDLVVFLDGMNDVAAAYQSGTAGVHQNYPALAARMEGREDATSVESPIWTLLKRTNAYILLSQLLALNPPLATNAEGAEVLNYRTFGRDATELSREVADVMLGNYDIVRGLADEWDFQVVFFLQPTLWTGSKELTSVELGLRAGDATVDGFPIGSDPDLEPLLDSCYILLESAADSLHDMFSLTSVFDEANGSIYTDYSGVHVIPDGNRIMSEEMVRNLDTMSIFTDTLSSDQTPGA